MNELLIIGVVFLIVLIVIMTVGLDDPTIRRHGDDDEPRDGDIILFYDEVDEDRKPSAKGKGGRGKRH